MSFLKQIQADPLEIKKLNIDELKQLAKEIRQTILDTVLTCGGHLASSLGVVEVVIAMHYVFDVTSDKFIFDVGHQSYAHKLITGRLDRFSTLRQKGGIAGFPKMSESIYDIANTGHSSTSISLGTGFAKARSYTKKQYEVISVVGDGAMTGGLCYEALNFSSDTEEKQIVILNDNEMSISKNVGSTARYLMRLHNNSVYRKFKRGANKILGEMRLSSDGEKVSFFSNLRNSIKYFIQKGMPFEQYGYKYYGPINGHNLEELIEIFRNAKQEDESVILHVITKKGKGFAEAEENPSKYHGYSKSSKSLECEKNFSTEFGKCLTRLAEDDPKIVAITAAMTEGTGLKIFEDKFPDRLLDVGIAEAQGVCMASALAIEGIKPYFAVYSSFLQRGFDQLIHDVALQKQPVRFCIDRSGLVPGDGETHQGIYDTSFLRTVPKMNIIAPCDTIELQKVLKWSLTFDKPLAIKYPKGCYKSLLGDREEFILGKWNYIVDNKSRSKISLLCAGALMVSVGTEVATLLLNDGILVNIINSSSIKPLDEKSLDKLAEDKLFTLEDNTINGGFASAVTQFYVKCKKQVDLTVFAVAEDETLTHAKVSELLEMCKLDAKSIYNVIKENVQATIVAK